jgi:hypothetical protein
LELPQVGSDWHNDRARRVEELEGLKGILRCAKSAVEGHHQLRQVPVHVLRLDHEARP